MSNITAITEENFENEVTLSPVPVMIDFYADWCGPCQAMMPVVEEIAKEYDGEIKICKIDVGAQRKLAMENKVMSVPTLLFLKNGSVIERIPSALTAEALRNKLDGLKEI